MTSPRVPFTVIGGFLGAGKTTLLNHWLRHADGKRIAVLVNDFGALNIDASLIESSHGDVIGLTNGCVCCQIGDDLSLALMQLLDSGAPFDAVVVEASGVSDPWRIAQLGRADPRLRLDAVVVLVDAGAALDQARDPLLADTLERQLAKADLVVVNKTDLTTAHDLTALRAWLGSQGRPARVIDVMNAAVLAALLSAAMLPSQTSTTDVRGTGAATPFDRDCAMQQPDQERHLVEFRRVPGGHGAQFEAWSCRPTRTFSETELRAWMQAPPDGLLRLKGLIRSVAPGGEARWSALHFAGREAMLQRASTAPENAALVAIGLRGHLPAVALAKFFARTETPLSGRDPNSLDG